MKLVCFGDSITARTEGQDRLDSDHFRRCGINHESIGDAIQTDITQCY